MAMKNFLTMAALALVGAIIAGCSGSDDIIDDAPQPATQKDNIVTMKTTVGLDGGGETRALTSGGVKTFAVGDQMAVFFTNTSGRRIALNSHALTAEDITNNGKSATFTFDFVHPRTHCIPDTRENLQYVYPSEFIQTWGDGQGESLEPERLRKDQEGTLQDISERLDLTTYEGPWIGDGILPSATLENQIAILAIKLKDDATDQYITSSITYMTIDIYRESNDEVFQTYIIKGHDDDGHIYMGIYPDDIKSDDVIKVNATDGTNLYSKTLTGKSYAKGNGYNITWRMMTVGIATPLTMEALSDGTIKVNNPRPGMQFSLNGGTKTTMNETTTTTINVNTGDKVQFYGNGTNITAYWEGDEGKYTTIADGTASVKVYGSIMSLVDEMGFAINPKLSSDVEHTFQYLFQGNTTLIDASGLLLPATGLSNYCYAYMFNGCTNLTDAPELPAEELKEGCYQGMFQGCTSLTKAPELPAEDLVKSCYQSMFSGCSSLSSVTCFATSGINELSSTYNWLSGVAGGGTFTRSVSAEGLWPRGVDGIPVRWSVEEQ